MRRSVKRRASNCPHCGTQAGEPHRREPSFERRSHTHEGSETPAEQKTFQSAEIIPGGLENEVVLAIANKVGIPPEQAADTVREMLQFVTNPEALTPDALKEFLTMASRPGHSFIHVYGSFRF